MDAKKWIALAGLLLGVATLVPAVSAADTPGSEGQNPPTPPAESTTKDEAAPKKVGFFGDRFAMYVEAYAGLGQSAKDIDTSLATTPLVVARGETRITDLAHARVGLGWQLPFGRGRILAIFNANSEREYETDGFGALYRVGVIETGGITDTSDPIIWWTTRIRDGELRAVQTIPYWSLLDVVDRLGKPVLRPCNTGQGSILSASPDCDGNGKASQNEVAYLEGPSQKIRRVVPDNLQNRIQTLDLGYQREFGGRKVKGRWFAGLRRFVYEGSVPAVAWLHSQEAPGFGYTDGAATGLIHLSQRTTGWGPAANLEVQWHLFLDRLTLFAQGRVAFVVQDLETDTGWFSVYVRERNTPAMYPAPVRLQESLNSSSWQVGAEAGVRIRLAEGFLLELAYNRTAYQDAVLLPKDLSLPDTVSKIGQGAAALYGQQDLMLDTWHMGFSYQF